MNDQPPRRCEALGGSLVDHLRDHALDLREHVRAGGHLEGRGDAQGQLRERDLAPIPMDDDGKMGVDKKKGLTVKWNRLDRCIHFQYVGDTLCIIIVKFIF